MKKIIFIVLMFFTSFLGFSQLTENFEGTADPDNSGNWELGSGTWKIFDNGVGPLQSWKPITSSLFTYEGIGRSADVSKEPLNPGSTTEEWLVTPRKTMRANEQLRFFTRQGLSGDNFTTYEVRVSQNADPLLKSAYVTIKTYTEAELNPDPIPFDQYNEKTISLGTRTGQSLYIAFVKVFTQTETNNGGDRWLIDNVNLVPECLTPTITQQPLPTAHTALLRWVSTATNFNVQYRLFGTTDEWTSVNNITGLSTTIENLQAGTRYEFRVMAICSEGSTSNWSAPYFFDTFVLGAICQDPKVVTGLPYSDLSNTLVYGNHIDETTPGTSCGGTADYLESLDAVYQYTATETGVISISMNPYGATNTGVFVYANCAAIGNTCLAGVGNSNGNIRTITSLNVVAGQSYYIVVSSTDATFNFQYLLLIQKVSCAAPTALTATVTGPNGVNLAWGPATTTATEWQVGLQPDGSTVPQDGDGITRIVNTTIKSHTFDDLTTGTNYQYWVRAKCADGVTYSPWAGPFPFLTSLCAVSDQCNFTFTLGDSGNDGWEGGRMQVIQNGQVVATLGATITGGSATVTVPLCNGIPFSVFWNVSGNTPSEMRFTIKNKFDQLLYTMPVGSSALFNTTLFSQMVDCTTRLCLAPSAGIGVVPAGRSVVVNFTNPGPTVPPPPAPVPVQGIAVLSGQPAPEAGATGYTVSQATAHTRIEILNLTPETVYDLYLRSDCSVDGRMSEWVKVRTFTTLAVCFKPTSLGNATNLQLTSAQVSWVNPSNSGANSWQVYAVETGGAAPTAQTIGRVATSNTAFVLDNLNSGTCYDYYVRADCGDVNGMSSWTGPKSFCTKICEDAEKCVYTFTFGGTFNGAVMQVRQNGVPVGNNITATGPQVRSLCSGIPFELFWLTAGTNPTLVSVTSIKNSFNQTMFTMPAGNEDRVGTSLYASIADCQNPACLPPTTVAGDVRIHGATITWASSGTPSTSWEYYYQPLDGTANPVQTTNDLSAILSNLEAGTTYQFFVRSVCTVNSPSIWTAAYQFTTLPSCPTPTNIIVAPLVDGSRITWDNVENTALSWEYIVVLPGASPPVPGQPGTGLPTASYTSPVGMEAGFYDFYVRSLCSGTDSEWLGPISFFVAVPPPRCLEVGVNSGDVVVTDGSNPSGVLDLCAGESTVDLTAIFPASNATTSYAITSLRYAPPYPFTGGEIFRVTGDDKWAPVFTLPYKFCFFGEVFTTVQVGTNGVVSLGSNFAPNDGVDPFSGATCPWDPLELNIPNSGFPIKNAIFGAFQDTDMRDLDGVAPEHNINFGVTGEAPCRAFVVNYYHLPQYNCEGDVGLQTSQIVMYENSNIIDVYIEKRTQCDWNDGQGVIGVINRTGQRAYSPTGRNTNDNWEAEHEAWRFTPAGESNVSLKWLVDDIVRPEFTTPNITLTVNQNTNVKARATYKTCGNPDVTKETEVLLKVGGLHIDPINDVISCDDTYQLPVLPIGNYYTDATHTTLLPAPFVISTSQRVYVYAESAAGIEPFCTAAQDYMVTVGGFHPPTPEGVTACRSYTLPILPAPYNYYTGPNGTGQQYLGTAQDVITTSQLPMYIYAANADCSGQSSFNIIIETPKVPDFNLPAFVCTGTTYPTLGTTSPNGVTGVWTPTTTIVDSGTYTFTPTAGLCAEPKDYVISVVQTLTPDFNVTEVVLCSGGAVPTLLTTSPNGVVGTWNPSVVSNTQSGTYIFRATPIAGQCFNEVQLPVVVNENPAFSLAGDCNQSNVYEITATLAGNISASEVTFAWTDPSGAPAGTTQSIIAKTTGVYTCVVTLTATGCSSSEPWNVIDNGCTIQKGISPKGVGPGDGKNDFFDLEGMNVKELEIFNRYGTKVYSMANYTNQWYGQSKKGEELPDGTYYYVIKRDSAETQTGWIYINREK